MLYKEKYNWFLGVIYNHKQTDSFVNAEDSMILYKESFFKKDPKCLDSVIMKKIFSEKDSLSLILKGHLYLEVLLNDIIKTETRNEHITSKKLKNLLDMTFYNKLDWLNKKGLFENTLYNDLYAINKYRNKFAHNFDYNICDLTLFEDFSLYKETSIIKKIKKVEREALFRYAIRFAFMYTFENLYSKFSYLLALKKDNK